MTNETRYVYDINGQIGPFGIPETTVVDGWEGGIDADGVQIQDAYRIEDIKITGNPSTKQLELLAQIVNTRTLFRYSNPDIKVTTCGANGSLTCQKLLTNLKIGGRKINGYFNPQGLYTTVSPYIMSNLLYNGELVYIQLSPQDVSNLISLFPHVDGVTIDTTPIPYYDYAFYKDTDQNVNMSLYKNRLFYIDENGDTLLLRPYTGLQENIFYSCGFRMYAVAYKDFLNEVFVIAEYHDSPNVTFYDYVYNPGLSGIITNEFLDVNSRVLVTHKYSAGFAGKWPGIFGSGAHNSSQSLCVNYEEYVTGTLHISWLGNTSWTNLPNIYGDYNKHVYDVNKNNFYLDGLLVNTRSNNNSYATISKLILSGRDADDLNDDYTNSCKLYNAFVWQDDVPSSILFPAVVNNVAGMYDLLNNQFYTSYNQAVILTT